jgi:hypothetical protein
MSLFQRLLKLFPSPVPTEDFFTEILGFLFSTSPHLLKEWLEIEAILPISNAPLFHVSTQQTFAPLANHNGISSRPDIVITVQDGHSQSLIFIESKVGSKEGVDQLSRYAEILAAQTAVQQRYLVYITRDYDPKEEKSVLKNILDVKFIQLRWQSIYRFLINQKQTGFITQILRFMEEQRMANSTIFTPTDILALTQIDSVLKLMDETLAEEVEASFIKSVGPARTPRQNFKGLSSHQRYLITANFVSQMWCGLGYFTQPSGVHNFPSIGIMLEVPPRAAMRNEIITVLKEIAYTSDWQGYRLDQPSEWAGITKTKSLRDFMTFDDHVAAIKAYFLEILQEVPEIKQRYPNLQWTTLKSDLK